jgi:hypothetical protein
MEELTRLSSRVHHLPEELSLEVSEVLDMSLSEVQAQYFRDEESMVEHIMMEEQNRLHEKLAYREEKELEDTQERQNKYLSYREDS